MSAPRLAERSGPLSGVVAVEIGESVAEHAGSLLAGLGALVIKVESPLGSTSRRVGPFGAADANGERPSVSFWARNAGKLSIELDLDQPADLATLTRLVERADVVLEGRDAARVLDGQLTRLVPQWNDQAIHCVVSPFGEESPWSGNPWSELTALALGGIAGVSGYDHDQALDGAALPIAPAGVHSGSVGGALAVIGVISQLLAREATGAAQPVEVALHDAFAVSTEFSVPGWSFGGAELDRHTGRHASAGSSPVWNVVCGDGVHLAALPLYLNDKRFGELLGWLASENREQDLADERWRDGRTRDREMSHIMDVIADFCAQHTSEEIFHGAQARGLAWSPIRSPSELVDDSYLEQRKFFAPIETGQHGVVKFPGVAYKGMASAFDSVGIDLAPPRLGQDSAAVLDWLER